MQPLAAWTEVWVLRRGDDASWTIETLTPATTDPDTAVGYVEAAGFSPDGGRLLVVREARARRSGHAALPGRRRRDAGRREVGGARRQAGRVQTLGLAVVARRNAGAAMKASTFRLAFLLAIAAPSLPAGRTGLLGVDGPIAEIVQGVVVGFRPIDVLSAAT